MSLTTANTDPIYASQWTINGGGAIIGPSANTATDGTGANTFLIFTADANADGSFIQRVVCKPVASPAATVIRLWWLNATGAYTAGTTNTAANTYLIDEITAAATTVSQTAASIPYVFTLNFGIPASTKLLMSFGTSTGAAGNGYNPIVIAAKY